MTLSLVTLAHLGSPENPHLALSSDWVLQGDLISITKLLPSSAFLAVHLPKGERNCGRGGDLQLPGSQTSCKKCRLTRSGHQEICRDTGWEMSSEWTWNLRQAPWHQFLFKANVVENDLGDSGNLKNNMIYTMRLERREMLKEQTFLKCSTGTSWMLFIRKLFQNSNTYICVI